MKARLTIYCKEPLDIFFSTKCELDYFGKNAQITFTENREDNAISVINQIGISRKKIIIVSSPSVRNKFADDEANEIICILSEENPRTRRAKFEMDKVDLLLRSDGMKITMTPEEVKVKLKVCFSNGDHKSPETTLFLNCKVSAEA